MNESKILRNVLETHGKRPKLDGFMQKCTGCPWIGWNHDSHVVETMKTALIQGRTITTVDELDALTSATDVLGGAIIRNVVGGFADLYEKNSDNTWCEIGRPDAGINWVDREIDAKDLTLPATLIWEPTP